MKRRVKCVCGSVYDYAPEEDGTSVPCACGQTVLLPMAQEKPRRSSTPLLLVVAGVVIVLVLVGGGVVAWMFRPQRAGMPVASHPPVEVVEPPAHVPIAVAPAKPAFKSWDEAEKKYIEVPALPTIDSNSLAQERFRDLFAQWKTDSKAWGDSCVGLAGSTDGEFANARRHDGMIDVSFSCGVRGKFELWVSIRAPMGDEAKWAAATMGQRFHVWGVIEHAYCSVSVWNYNDKIDIVDDLVKADKLVFKGPKEPMQTVFLDLRDAQVVAK